MTNVFISMTRGLDTHRPFLPKKEVEGLHNQALPENQYNNKSKAN